MGINIVAKSMVLHEFIVKHRSGAKLVKNCLYNYGSITSEEGMVLLNIPTGKLVGLQIRESVYRTCKPGTPRTEDMSSGSP